VESLGSVESLGGAPEPSQRTAPHRSSRGSGATGVRGPALGIFAAAEYTNQCCGIEAGDILLLFTDGLFEIENAEGELLSEAGLRRTVANLTRLSPEALIPATISEAEKFASGRPFPDDLCVVGVEIARLEPGPANGNGRLARRDGNGGGGPKRVRNR
jgi:hypothetical protein